MPELLGRADIKLISCHLGGSSSLCAIRNGQSVACSLGMSPQSGPAAQQPRGRLRRLRPAGHPARDRQDASTKSSTILANQSGLEGLSGAGCDLRDIEAAAAAGNAEAELAIDVFIASIRHYLGAYLLELDGADAIVFTGGIGENSVADPRGRLPRPGLVRHRARPGAERRRTGRAPGLDRRLARPGLDRADQRGDRGRPAGPSNCSNGTEPQRVTIAMFLARVTGSVVATQKVASMTGHKLLTVEPYRVDEKGATAWCRPAARSSWSTRWARASTRWS